MPVDPVPQIRVINRKSVSANPDRSVLYIAVRVSHYELLKHVVDVLICDDRQR